MAKGSNDKWRIGPVASAACLIEGAGLTLRDRGLRRLFLVTLVFNVLVFCLVVAGLIAGSAWATEVLIPERLSAIRWVIRAAVLVGAFFIAPLLFQIAANIVLLALRERIFAAARVLSGGERFCVDGVVGPTARIIATEIRRLVRVIVLSLLILPLNLIPIAGSIVYLVIQLVIASHALAWDLLSFDFEGRDLTYAQQKQRLARNRLSVLAFGSAALGLCLIPFAQLVFLTTNVAGAGVLSARIDAAPPR
ncbi:MAG: EI24 domain-containing protein [Planctomycetota bacterium]|jgi:uncharacterized protein involved in cysteine biosynthesis